MKVEAKLRLKDKVALITGSSRGIGEYIARAYAREGAKVIITYNKNKESAEKIAKEIDAPLCLHLDVKDSSSIKKAYEEVVEKVGKINILVCNAGINITNDYDKLEEADFQEVIDVDLTGVWRCTKEVLPFISDSGRIITIGSLSGEYGGPRTPSYAAAKAGVEALTQCLARYVAHRKITVNCLSPGVIASDLTEESMSQGVKDVVNSLVLLKRFGKYSELEEPAIFLASDGSSYMTAQTLSINGGAWW